MICVSNMVWMGSMRNCRIIVVRRQGVAMWKSVGLEN